MLAPILPSPIIASCIAFSSVECQRGQALKREIVVSTGNTSFTIQGLTPERETLPAPDSGFSA
jgi:hypothetical protein